MQSDCFIVLCWVHNLKMRVFLQKYSFISIAKWHSESFVTLLYSGVGKKIISNQKPFNNRPDRVGEFLAKRKYPVWYFFVVFFSPSKLHWLDVLSWKRSSWAIPPFLMRARKTNILQWKVDIFEMNVKVREVL